jgi:hypothetical protein
MAVLAEMAEAAMSNPLGGASEAEAGEEDTDAALVEDTFSRVRSVICNQGGSVRRPIVVLQSYTYYGTIFLVFAVPIISIALNQMPEPSPDPMYVNGNVVHDRLIDMLEMCCMSLSMAGLSRFPTELARVTRTGSEPGALVQLGAGSKRVAQREVSKLHKWPMILAVIAIPIALYGLVIGSVVTMLIMIYALPVRWNRSFPMQARPNARAAFEFQLSAPCVSC